MDLSAILSSSKEVEFKGVKIEIKQITLEHLPEIAKVADSFFSLKGTTQQKIVKFISSDMDGVTTLISNLSNIPKEAVGRISLDALIFIISEIVTENNDFLQKSVAPRLKEMTKSMGGLTSSKT